MVSGPSSTRVRWRGGTPLWCADWPDRPLDVVGVGENSLDQVCLIDEWPAPGADVALAGYEEQPGGQVATAILACQRLGLRAGYVGCVGDDAEAEAILEPLEREGVDLSAVRTVPGVPSRRAVIWVERPTGERTVFGSLHPSLRLRPRELTPDAVTRARVLHLDARDPELALWAARTGREAGCAVVLDVDRAGPGVDALLRLVDFPIVARRFAEEWGRGGSVREGARAIARHCGQPVVVTLGGEGVLVAEQERVEERPAFRVKARDTTGAGDAFRAGFIWALLEGLDPHGVLDAAQAVAALDCAALGAQGGLPTRPELERFLAVHRSS